MTRNEGIERLAKKLAELESEAEGPIDYTALARQAVSVIEDSMESCKWDRP